MHNTSPQILTGPLQNSRNSSAYSCGACKIVY